MASTEHVSTTKTRKWWRRLRTVLGLLLSAAGCYYVARTLLSASASIDWSAHRPSAGWLALSIALTCISSLLGGAMWRYLLLAFGYDVPVGRCTSIQTSAALLKYIPGFVWQPLGKAHGTERAGVPLGVTGVVILVEFGALIGSGMLLLGPLLPDDLIAQVLPWPPSVARAVYCTLTVVLVAVCFAGIRPIGRLIARLTGIDEFRRLGRKPLALALLVALVAWVLLCVGFGAGARALGPMTLSQWLLAAATLPAGLIAGLVVIVAPAGLGIRESLMLLMLGTAWSPGLAALIAALSRGVFLVAEVLAWLLVKVLHTATRHNESITRTD